MLELLLFLTVALPIAWFLSEFQRHRWISVVLGILSLVVVWMVTYGWCTFSTKFNLNVLFGEATKTLLVTVSDALNDGHVELVQRELGTFAERYDPNYENSPRYHEEADKLAERLRTGMSANRISPQSSEVHIAAKDEQVIVSGEYNLHGKFGPFIRLGETGVYLVADQSASWPDFDGKQVIVTGDLRLEPAGISKSDVVAVPPARLLLTTTPQSIAPDDSPGPAQ